MNPYAGGTKPPGGTCVGGTNFPGGAYADGIYPGCGAGVVGK